MRVVVVAMDTTTIGLMRSWAISGRVGRVRVIVVAVVVVVTAVAVVIIVNAAAIVIVRV